MCLRGPFVLPVNLLGGPYLSTATEARPSRLYPLAIKSLSWGWRNLKCHWPLKCEWHPQVETSLGLSCDLGSWLLLRVQKQNIDSDRRNTHVSQRPDEKLRPLLRLVEHAAAYSCEDGACSQADSAPLFLVLQDVGPCPLLCVAKGSVLFFLSSFKGPEEL